MKTDYSPSKLSRSIRLLVAILLPVVVTVVFLLVLGMDKDSHSLLVVCSGCSLMGSGIILLSSYYPVFLQDRLVIRNDIIRSSKVLHAFSTWGDCSFGDDDVFMMMQEIPK